MGARGPGGGFDFLSGRSQPSAADVLRHAAIKQHGFLADEGHELPKVRSGDCSQVAAVDFDGPACGIVKTKHEIHESALARAALTRDSQFYSARRDYVHIAQ